MKTLTLALALLILPVDQQQLKASTKNDTSTQYPEKTFSVVVPTEQAASNRYTASANDQKHDNAKTPPPALKTLTCAERLRQWWNSLTTADLTLIVTALYLIATVLIWLAMLAANKHAKEAYEATSKGAAADREITRRMVATAERQFVAMTEVARARITIEEFERLDIEAGTDGYGFLHFVKVTLSNSGQTPATDAVLWGGHIIAPFTKTPRVPANEGERRYSLGMVAAGRTRSYPLPVDLTSEDLKAIRSYERGLYLWGVVEYGNVFIKERRRLEFSAMFTDKGWDKLEEYERDSAQRQVDTNETGL